MLLLLLELMVHEQQQHAIDVDTADDGCRIQSTSLSSCIVAGNPKHHTLCAISNRIVSHLSSHYSHTVYQLDCKCPICKYISFSPAQCIAHRIENSLFVYSAHLSDAMRCAAMALTIDKYISDRAFVRNVNWINKRR